MRYCACAVVTATAPALFAAHISPEAALARALKSSDVRHAPSKVARDYRLAYTADDYVYVFSVGDKGFMALPADDSAPAVLGYSSDGAFDADSMPPSMRWWLGEYAREMKAAANQSRAAVVPRAERKPIEPMVKTHWNQDAPFNDKCPLIGGKRAVTGCVATALAQVMNYHQWPPKGRGSNSYDSNGTPLSLDFSTITFDWANMLDDYNSGTASAVSNDAVATLMYACGVSVDMSYTATESGASSMSVAAAMVNYFNYDAGIRFAERDYFGLTEWEDFVYSQLVDYGPVQYSGTSNDGGHSFVCDGYSSDGYFHINWGWGGMSDGYFLLSALDPGQQGIGGSTSGFNYGQDIIANVSKPRGGSVMYPNLKLTANYGVEQQSAILGDYIQINGNIYNFSTGALSGTLGVRLVRSSDGSVRYVAGGPFDNLQPLEGFGGYYVALPEDLAAGTYIMTPAFRSSANVWTEVPVKISAGVQKIRVTVQGRTAYFEDVEGGSVVAKSMRLLTGIYFGQQFRLTATLSNPGASEYYGTIVPALLDGETVVALADNYPVDILAGDEVAMDYVGTFNRFTSQGVPAAGSYTLCLLDSETLEAVSQSLTVTVNASPSTTELSVPDFKVGGDAANVDASSLAFSGTVSCAKGYFGGSLTIAIFPYAPGEDAAVATMTAGPVFVGEGQTAHFDASGAQPALKSGNRYIAAVFRGQQQISSAVYFTVSKDFSGIEAPDTAADSPVTVYTPAGICVGRFNSRSDADATALAPGIYLYETYAPTRKVERILRH